MNIKFDKKEHAFVRYKHRYLGNAKQISCGKLGQLDFPFGWPSSKSRLPPYECAVIHHVDSSDEQHLGGGSNGCMTQVRTCLKRLR